MRGRRAVFGGVAVSFAVVSLVGGSLSGPVFDVARDGCFVIDNLAEDAEAVLIQLLAAELRRLCAGDGITVADGRGCFLVLRTFDMISATELLIGSRGGYQ